MKYHRIWWNMMKYPWNIMKYHNLWWTIHEISMKYHETSKVNQRLTSHVWLTFKATHEYWLHQSSVMRIMYSLYDLNLYDICQLQTSHCLAVSLFRSVVIVMVTNSSSMQLLLLAAMVFSRKEETWEGRVHRQDLLHFGNSQGKNAASGNWIS